MTDKQLKRLKRSELLQLLLEQTKRADELEEKLKEKDEELHQREIDLEEAGNIAAASVKLNNIFETAQNTADQYIENIIRLKERLENKLKEEENKS